MKQNSTLTYHNIKINCYITNVQKFVKVANDILIIIIIIIIINIIINIIVVITIIITITIISTQPISRNTPPPSRSGLEALHLLHSDLHLKFVFWQLLGC